MIRFSVTVKTEGDDLVYKGHLATHLIGRKG